jgi:hypothetical protein
MNKLPDIDRRDLELTREEAELLDWLGEEELSQYGECNGRALDHLIEQGLAEVLGPETSAHNPFIAKGTGMMYRAVKLTEAGYAMALERLGGRLNR